MKPANWSRRLSAGTLIAAGTAGSMVLLSAVAPAGAVTGPSGPGSGEVVVPQGITAASLHGTRISAAPASTRLTVSFVLKLRNVNELKSDVEGGMKHGFLSVKRFSSRYGQTHANIVALERYLKNHGIKSTTYADGLDIHTTGTAGDYTAALGTPESLYRLKAVPAHGNQAARPAMVVHGTTSPALLPARFGKFVFAVLGLTNYPVQASNAVHTPLATQKANGHAQSSSATGPQATSLASTASTRCTRRALRGQGETLGIITFANFRPSDATHFWNTTLKIKTKARRIKQDNVDGGPGRPSANSGSGETTLDVEQSGALAPQASIIVYQAPNSDFGAADAWFTAASQNKAASVSTSWGESEILNEAIGADGLEAATYGGIFDEAGLEMAAQGQSAFDASGDLGAYDDAEDVNPSNGNPTPYTELSVDNPANSPWVTAAGGTTNSGQIPIADSQNAGLPHQHPEAAGLGVGLLVAVLRDHLLHHRRCDGGLVRVRPELDGWRRRRLQHRRDPAWLPEHRSRCRQFQRRAVSDADHRSHLQHRQRLRVADADHATDRPAMPADSVDLVGVVAGRRPHRRRSSPAPPAAGPCPTSLPTRTRTPDTSCTTAGRTHGLSQAGAARASWRRS